MLRVTHGVAADRGHQRDRDRDGATRDASHAGTPDVERRRRPNRPPMPNVAMPTAPAAAIGHKARPARTSIRRAWAAVTPASTREGTASGRVLIARS